MALQAIAITSVLGALVAMLLLYRHLTDAVFTPITDFVLSANLAVPPLFAGVATYLVVILLGEDVKETRVKFLAWIRNEVMTSSRNLIALAAAGAAVSVSVLLIILRITPPRYDAFVTRLLGSEQDRFELAKADIDGIRKTNPELAHEYELVLQVFEERARANFAADEMASPARSRLLVRALDTDIRSGWYDHPLRWHGLAEAYSLWAEQVSAAARKFGGSSAEAKLLFSKSIQLYDQVLRSSSPLVTRHLRLSAAKNIGNVYYYQEDLQRAYESWREVNHQSPELGVWGNAIAALVQLGRLDEAIREAGDARRWAEESGRAVLEPSGYSSILVNEGFAKVLLGNPDEAATLFGEAVNVEDDQLNRLNLVFGWILAGQHDRATRYLSSFVRPVDTATQAEVVLASKGDRCAYLLWALADFNAPLPITAARLRVYLGHARSPAELGDDASNLATLRKTVWDYLESSRGLCADFRLIPQTRALIESIAVPVIAKGGAIG